MAKAHLEPSKIFEPQRPYRSPKRDVNGGVGCGAERSSDGCARARPLGLRMPGRKRFFEVGKFFV
jgi:hypothetical protein